MFKLSKYSLIVFIFNIASSIYSQKQFSEIVVDKEIINSSNTLSVVDNNDNIYLFFISSNKIHYIKQTSNGEKILENYYENDQEFIFNNSRGYTITENNEIVLYFSNKWNSSYTSVLIPNQKDDKHEINSFEIKNSKEKFFFYAKNDKKFFLYNYLKNSSVLIRYELSKEGFKNSVKIDLSNERFYDEENNICNLYEILKSNKNASVIKDYNESSTSNTLPISIEVASNKVKIYQGDRYHTITLNHRKSATRTIKINIENPESSELGYYPIPTVDFNQIEIKKSNSYIFKGVIYQFICSKQRINLSAFKLDSKIFLKEYKYAKEDTLTIMNSTIMQEGWRLSSSRKRELAKTSQFLRKLTNSQDIGLFAYESEGNINLTIGGTSELKTPITAVGLPIGGVGLMTLSMGAYFSYSTTKSIFINCLFDNNFNHLSGDTKENIFDRIHKYGEILKNSEQFDKLKFETVFEYRNKYMQGVYNKRNQKYFLITH